MGSQIPSFCFCSALEERELYKNSHLIEVGACGVRRTGGAGWKNHFCITEERLSFLTRTVDAASDAVRVWSFPLVSGEEAPSVTIGGSPLVQRLGSPVDNHSAGQTLPGLRHNAGAVVAHTSSCLLLLLQCPHSIGFERKIPRNCT